MASKTPSDKAANVSETARDVVSDANSRASQAVSAASQRVRQVFQGSRTLDECERIMTAPGSLHEMRWELVDGRLQRVYVNVPPTIRAEFLGATEAFADRTGIVYQQDRFTYRQIRERVATIAHMLQNDFKVKKGTKVAVVMRNLPEWAFCFWAITSMGGIAVAINAWLSDDALQHVLERSGARICIADQERAKRLHPILTDLRRGGIKAILVARSDGVASGMLSFEKAVAKYDQPRYHQLPEAEVAPDDMATIYTTSGTTSMPKLVPATHRMYVSNIANNATSRYRACLRRGEPPPVFNPADPQKSLLLSVPLFHVTANHSFLQTTLIGGGKLVLMPKWNVKEAMRLIKEENITAAGGVPSMAFELVENDDGKSLASLDTLSYGGAAAAESLPEAASGRLPNLMVGTGYGLTETNAYAIGVSAEDYVSRPTTAGLAAPAIDVLVMHPEKPIEMPKGKDHLGEIWLRGCSVVREYYNDPEATEKAFTKDGWFKTGDLGYIDEQGFIYVCDRAKDVIIRGGENIASTQVENAIYADHRILDAAVVAVPDPKLGELVAAVVTPKQAYRGQVTEEQVMDAVRKRLPKHCVPVFVDVREETLERNANGKIVKKDLKEKVAKLWKKRTSSKL